MSTPTKTAPVTWRQQRELADRRLLECFLREREIAAHEQGATRITWPTKAEFADAGYLPLWERWRRRMERTGSELGPMTQLAAEYGLPLVPGGRPRSS